MASERKTICKYYICRGECQKGYDAEVLGICQHCTSYIRKEGAAPFRKDNRRKKLEKIEKRASKDW